MEKGERKAMINFEFDYYRPSTMKEAVDTFTELRKEGKNPIYYAGGTEIICRARLKQMVFDAVIDIKEIPECNILEIKEGELLIGAAVTLAKISEAGAFPLLDEVCKSAADHTARDKITLGGNICGNTHYKEAILPFLVADSTAVIAGTDGTRRVPLNKVFDKSLQLEAGEFLVQLATDQDYLSLPYTSKKRTRFGKTDYPLVSMAAIKQNNEIRVALSGACDYPFRSREVEKQLSDRYYSIDKRIDKAIHQLPYPISNDLQGSAEYREFILTNMLFDALTTLEGVN